MAVTDVTLAPQTRLVEQQGIASREFYKWLQAVNGFMNESVGGILLFGVKHVSSVAALKASDPIADPVVVLNAAYRWGVFYARAGNFASLVAADTQNGWYVKANDYSSSSYAYVRDGDPFSTFNIAHGGATPGAEAYNAFAGIASILRLTTGGTIIIPFGVLLNTGVTFTSSDANHRIRITGPGYGRGAIVSTTANIYLFTLSAQKVYLDNFTISAIGVQSTSGALFRFTAGAVKVTTDNLDLYGGCHSMHFDNGGANIAVRGGWMQKVYGDAIIKFENCPGAVKITDVALDTAWPSLEVSATSFSNPDPSGSSDKGAWAAGPYALKDFVTVGNYLLQCVQAGTTDASAPNASTFKYNTNITDGSVIWRFAGHADCYPIRVKGGPTFDILADHVDLTGAYKGGVCIEDPDGSGPPNWIKVLNCTVAATHGEGIRIKKAKNVKALNNDLQQFFGGTGDRVAIKVDGGAGATVTAMGNKITQANYGLVPLEAGIRIGVDGGLYADNYVRGATVGILVEADLSKQNISDNDLGNLNGGTACTTGVYLTAGTGDYHRVLNNDTTGCTTDFVDGPGGAHSWIEGNGP